MARRGIAGSLGRGVGGALRGEGLAQALASAGQERPGGDVTDAQGGGQLEAGQVVQLGEQEGRALPLRDLLQGPLHVAGQPGVHDQVLGGRRRPLRLARPRQEADDLAAADLVEGDAVGDLVQPRPRVLRLLQRLVVLVRLDERVLGHVGGDLGVAHHPQEVGVDLALVLGEQRLDEARGLVPVPRPAHRAASSTRQRRRSGRADREIAVS